MQALLARLETLTEGVRVERFDAKRIDAFRKDFLLLMKNVKVVKDYEQAERWRMAMANWVTSMRDYFDGIAHWLDRMATRREGSKLSQSNADWLKQELRTAYWDVQHEARVPIQFPDDYYSSESRFYQLKAELKKWEPRAKRAAVKSWKLLKQFTETLERILGAKADIEHTTDEQVEIEGFKIIVRGKDETGDDFHSDVIGKFRAALRHYKRRAKAVFPLLIAKQVPMVFDHTQSMIGETAATYHFRKRIIEINAPGLISSGKEEIAHTLAHEMGHHIWQTVLSGKAQKFWTDVVYGKRQKLDLRDVISKYPTSKEFRRIEKTNPILHLQLQGLQHRDDFDAYSPDAIRSYLDGGGKPVIQVMSTPVTGYANTNAEEAFCEALGMLVGYGPATVLPVVRQILREILPGAKIHESIDRDTVGAMRELIERLEA